MLAPLVMELRSIPELTAHLLRRSAKRRRSAGGRTWLTDGMAVTVYGVCALTFMMVMYALESRGRQFVLGFAVGCVLSSIYGFLSGAWPFGVVELIWSAVALRRWSHACSARHGAPGEYPS